MFKPRFLEQTSLNNLFGNLLSPLVFEKAGSFGDILKKDSTLDKELAEILRN
jgi:hypothetical protein